MGRRHLAIGVVMLAILASQVGSGGDAADAGEVVATADRPRTARRGLAHVVVIDSDDDVVDERDSGMDDGVELFESDPALDNVDDDGALLDADGLTLDQRLAGTVAELEDRLPRDRGAIHGQIDDLESGELLAGVTVVVTSPGMEGAQTAITDEHGFYAITDLPFGTYLVTIYYLELTLERAGVYVNPREATPVYQHLNLNLPRSQGITITHDFVEEIEVVHAFSSNDTNTNTYYVDGIEVTGLEFGDTDPDADTGDITDPDNIGFDDTTDEETIE